MLIEYKIRFENGGLTITQQVTNTLPKAVPIGADHASVGKEFKVADPPAIPPAQGAKISDSAGGGEGGSPTTGGGGPGGIPGLTLVFGPVIGGKAVSALGSGELEVPNLERQAKSDATAH